MTRLRIAALSALLLCAASGAPGACSPFAAADDAPLGDAAPPTADTGSGSDDATVEVGAVDSGKFEDGAPAPCRTGAFGAPVVVTVDALPSMRSYRPWLEGMRAFGVTGGAAVFSVPVDPGGAPIGARTAQNVLSGVTFFSVNHAIASADGLSLYLQAKAAADNDPNRLWVMTRTDVQENFSNAQPLPFIPGGVALEPWAIDKGKTLYFSGIPSGGVRGLYVVRRDPADTAWLEPQPITELNRSPDDGFPVVTSDDLVLYYSSAGVKTDMWMSTRASASAPWGMPAAVTALNGPSEDRPTWISNDGCTLYFTSDRETANTYKLYRAVRQP